MRSTVQGLAGRLPHPLHVLAEAKVWYAVWPPLAKAWLWLPVQL